MTDELEPRPISPELDARLAAALQKIDLTDPKFKQKRDEERFAQTTKRWTRLCSEIDTNLRAIAKELHRTQSVSIDIGSDGGGQATKPFLEEMTGAFDRMVIKLEGQKAVATFQNKVLGTVPIDNVDYDWLEKMAVEWIVTAAESKRG